MSLTWQADHQCSSKKAKKKKKKDENTEKKQRYIWFKDLRDHLNEGKILLIKQSFSLFYIQKQSLVEQALLPCSGAGGHAGRGVDD